MKKNLFTTIILILIILGSCFKTDKDNFQATNIIEKDTIMIPPPTIDEIIEDGIPEDTTTCLLSLNISWRIQSAIFSVSNLNPI